MVAPSMIQLPALVMRSGHESLQISAYFKGIRLVGVPPGNIKAAESEGEGERECEVESERHPDCHSHP